MIILGKFIQELLIQAVRAEARLGLRGTSRLARLVYDADRRENDSYTGVVVYDGLLLQIDTSRFMEWCVYMYGGYDISGIRLLKLMTHPAAVVLDIGASVGLFTMPLAKKAGNAGAIHAFEPHPKTRARLLQNIALNNLRNITVSDAAMGSESGEATLYSPSKFAQGSSSLRYKPGFEESFACRVSTVDDYVDRMQLEQVDLMKVDVEGADYSVLLGAGNTLSRFKPAIFIEIEDQQLAAFEATAQNIFSLLKDAGYSIWRNEVHEYKRNFNLTPVSAGRTISGFENWLAVHCDSVPLMSGRVLRHATWLS